MQINAYSPSSVIAAQQGATGSSSDSAASQNAKAKARTVTSEVIAADTQAAAASSDTVSIRKLSATDIAKLDQQAANDSGNGSSGSNLLYAEIWKDGVKVGQVYSDGRVVGEGTTVDMGGTGILSAQTRAQQLASQMGGEVRYPGQSDPKAEKMRAQLRAAYGV